MNEQANYKPVDIFALLRVGVSRRWSYPPPTPVARAATVIYQDPHKYGVEFVLWLCDNWTVWLAFYNIAYEAERGGMKRWGAKGVIEVLRWKTAVRDSGGEFKINNNQAPMLGRLYNDIHPRKDGGFFVTRGGL